MINAIATYFRDLRRQADERREFQNASYAERKALLAQYFQQNQGEV